MRFVELVLMAGWSAAGLSAEVVSVGFGSADITPSLESGRKVWIAGYGTGRQALGVHDPLYARALVFESGGKKIAMAIVDLVGLQYPDVCKIREKLDGFDYVLVASTHQHEGPDVVGLWGEKLMKSGVDPEYIQRVVDRTAEAIRAADANLEPVTARYGTAVDEEILRDSRLPIVKDGVIRVIEFTRVKDKRPHAILVQQNCHPESLSSRNQYITADFPHFAIKALEEKHGCPVAMFSGPVGGLMALPGTIKDDDGNELRDGNFEYAEVYGNKLARRVKEAIESAEGTQITPITFGVEPVAVPLQNAAFKLAARTKALARGAVVYKEGVSPTELEVFDPRKHPNETPACVSEVAYIGLGDVHIACIPGEGYPESVYGKFQEPVEPNVDFPDAPLEKPVVDILPGKKILYIGLANDELGYIVPKRQWDLMPPFAYGRKDKQYGEINSCGPDVAPILYGALERAVKKAQP